LRRSRQRVAYKRIAETIRKHLPSFTRNLIAASVQRAELASELETEILKTAEQAGKLSEALRLVAARYERRRSRSGALRVRMWLPNTVLFIALVVGAIRAITAGTAFFTAVFQATIVAVVVITLTQMLVENTNRDASRWLSFGWRMGFHRSSEGRRTAAACM
jgi:hypothetical protein